MTRLIKFFSVFAIISLLTLLCYAESARDITSEVSIECENIIAGRIIDGNIATHSGGDNVKITVSSEFPIGGIYIKYNGIPTPGLLSDGSIIAENGFIHEFINIDGINEVTVSYESTDICDIQVFETGEIPKDIQVWQTGNQNTDILLCSTHSDDDQLFFAGLLPYYALYKDANVRVAYFINHFDTYNRTHELLDGLWHCGITNYPDISPFPDGYSESVDAAKRHFASRGITYDDAVSFQRDLLNKYKPLVVVLHDFEGEYGHGQHMLNTDSFIYAVENPVEGQHVPQKIYVHLYEENPIVLDSDMPLDIFGGLSAFNISQQAFGFHKSQHWTWFYNWIYGKNGSITKASQIESYNPCNYGLYLSTVGDDIEKNDLLENIETYSEKEKPVHADVFGLWQDYIPNLNERDYQNNYITAEDVQNDLPNENAQAQTNTTANLLIFPAILLILFASMILIIILKRRMM